MRARVIVAIALCGCGPAEEATRGTRAALSGSPVIVNECMSGSGGWIELLNVGSGPVDLALDPGSCFFVDDTSGGAAPRAVTDANVNHAPGSTTCAAAGRGPACGLVAPGEHVWVKNAYINSVTPDECRLLSAARDAATGACPGAPADLGVGGP